MYTMGHLTIHLTLSLLLVCLHMKGFVARVVYMCPEVHYDERALAKLKALVDENLENFQLAMTKMHRLKISIDGETSGHMPDISRESSVADGSLGCGSKKAISPDPMVPWQKRFDEQSLKMEDMLERMGKMSISVQSAVVRNPGHSTQAPTVATESPHTPPVTVPVTVPTTPLVTTSTMGPTVQPITDSAPVGPKAIMSNADGIIDCSTATVSGVYTFTQFGSKNKFYCHIDVDGTKWVVIQRRQDGSVNFTRNWLDYSKGFGDLTGEFWLGNDKIHALTATGLTTLRIDMDWGSKKPTVYYNVFKVAGEQDKYRLTASGFGGPEYADDALTNHSGKKFSTYDQDNDASYYADANCALMYPGGWWYHDCVTSNLNGDFNNKEEGIYWRSYDNINQIMKSTMMIRKP